MEDKERVEQNGADDADGAENAGLSVENEKTEKTEIAEKTERTERAEKFARARALKIEKRNQRNAEIANKRVLKNFLFWLMGVLFLPIVIVLGAVFVPTGVINGKNGQIVGEDLGKQSLFDVVRVAVFSPQELGFADFPIVAKTFSDLLETNVGEKDDGSGAKVPVTLGEWLYIDVDKLNSIKFGGGMVSEVRSCIEVVATLESLGGKSALGDVGDLNVFSEDEIVQYYKRVCTVEEVGTPDGLDNTAEGFDAAAYFYKAIEIDEGASEKTYKRAFKDDGALVAELSESEEEVKANAYVYAKADCRVADVGAGKGLDNTAEDFKPNDYYYKAKEIDAAAQEDLYKRAFNDDCSLVDELSGLSDDAKAAAYIYYPPLEKVKISELKNIFGRALGRATVKSFFDVLDGSNQTLIDIIGEETRVNELNDFDIDGVELNKILPAPDDEADPESEEYKRNRRLYDILRDTIDETRGETNAEKNANIKVGDISTMDTDRLHLKTVIGSSENNIIKTLIEKDATIGTLSTCINELKITEIFDIECFTEDETKALDTYSKYRLDDETGDYLLDNDGTYYVSKDAKIWLFILYEGGNMSTAANTEGSMETYEAQNVTLYGSEEDTSAVKLQDRIETVSSSLMDATIRQLVQTGILSESPSGKYASIYSRRLRGIIDDAA